MTAQMLAELTPLDLTPPADLPSRHAWRAPDAVACPKCKSHSGEPCCSTGGGNYAVVATHKARRARIAGWSLRLAVEAGWLAGRWQYRQGETWPDGMFDRFEAAAAPIPAKAAKQPTPKGVRLSEKQAEEIEHYVMCGGTDTVSTAHFFGDHQERQTVNALEAKGILEFVEMTTDHYERRMRLTPFGWQVYRQHRLIIRRLSEAEVDALKAKAARQLVLCPTCDEPLAGLLAQCDKPGCVRAEVAHDAAVDARCEA